MKRPISLGKPVKEIKDITVPIVNKLILETFDTICYRRQVKPEGIQMVLQAHSEGSSLR